MPPDCSCSFRHFFDRLPLRLRNLTCAYAEQAGVSLPMALSVLISATTTAAQRTMAIRLPDGGLESINHIDLIVAGSESGKNTLFRAVFAPVIDFDKAVFAIRTLSRTEGGELPDRSLLLSSNELPDLAEAIAGQDQSVTITLIDGSALLDSVYFRRRMSLTCELWDGQNRIPLRDKKSNIRTAFNAAVSILGMPQQQPLLDYLSDHGKSAVNVGLLQRCSITLPSSCFHYPDDTDPNCIAEYCRDMQAYLGDPESFARGETVEARGIPLATAASQRYLQLFAEQRQARIAGAPAPWRLLQKALKKSLPMQLLVSRRLDDPRVDPMAANTHPVLEISLEAFDAAYAYVQWQHDQEGMAAIRALVAPPMPIVPPLKFPSIKRSSAEKRRLQTIEDADELIRKLGEYMARHDCTDGVPVRDLKHRVGVYQARFDKALAYLVDEGYLTSRGGLLVRTSRHYRFGSAFPFADSGVYGSV